MKNYLIFTAILLTALLLACQQNNENSVEKAIPVKVFTVHPDTLSNYLEISGNLEAQNDAMIFSQVAEELKKISNVKEVSGSFKPQKGDFD